MVQKTIQHGGDGGTITEQLSPVFNGSVGCNQRAGSFVTLIRGVPSSRLPNFAAERVEIAAAALPVAVKHGLSSSIEPRNTALL